MRKSYAFLAAAIGAIGLMSQAPVARATILTGPVDTIYSDTFAAPSVNVNAAGVDPNSIAGNAPAVSTGLDGGVLTATYIGSAQQPAAGTGNPDAVWDYSGSNTATITSPVANVNTTGNIGEDAHTIDNLTLPLVPQIGKVYNLELTMTPKTSTGGHGLEMAFLWGNGNNHNTSFQAISNNDPVGLVLDRDAVAGSNYFEIFESTGTGADNSFSPSASATTGGTVGTPVTVDVLFTPTGATTGTMSWYLNGALANANPVNVTGLTGGISFIQFGTNQDSGTFSNFSLTAQTVPEPASLGLLAMGGLAMVRRRRGA